ncbi:VOC family protein [Paenibacillus flagellatus]|uniref:Lactoylglutathione lyase n=1 Tax=Paenibacillus flagellatus TaxID=2211139 RepID=A0A2V5KAG2_9BACL|nr:VOC family protein [Paenibacillus flagellatus]PYI56569.1 lactoylglutathione lyase [Paenibacillus flagellatus]
MLETLEHMQIPVRDLNRAVQWYTEHLGFRLGHKDGHRIAFLHLADGPMLMLWETKDETTANFSVNGTDFPVLLYRTRRIRELHDLLVRLGAPIQLYLDEGFGWVLKFYDPDGNLWGVIQHKE